MHLKGIQNYKEIQRKVSCEGVTRQYFLHCLYEYQCFSTGRSASCVHSTIILRCTFQVLNSFHYTVYFRTGVRYEEKLPLTVFYFVHILFSQNL
jgi:hypothetical protein